MGIFDEERRKTAEDTLRAAGPGTLAFVFVTDSHLSDSGEDTWENIHAVDNTVGYRFVLHGGDFLNGCNPPKLTARLYGEEAAAYAASIRSNKLFPVQGNHDGYRDETYLRQSVSEAKPDPWYHNITRFVDAYPETVRHGDDPYYYADFQDVKVRLAVMCSMEYTFDPSTKDYRHWFGMRQDQIDWFCGEVLSLPAGWTLLVCSHIQPVSVHLHDIMEGGLPEKGGLEFAELLAAVNRKDRIHAFGRDFDFTECGFDVACLIYGHVHGDCDRGYRELPMITTASQTAYVPQLWDMEIGGFPSPRTVGEVSQDCWDSVVLDPGTKTISFFRFGAGEDRVIQYDGFREDRQWN